MALRKYSWLVVTGAVSALVACGGGGGGDEKTTLCNSAGAQPKVVNGATCASYWASPVILLQIERADGQFVTCSGTRITANQVLTAAHCVAGKPKEVLAGNYQSDTELTGIAATSWAVHPDYSTVGFVYDAAVVTFPAGLPNPTMPILASEPASSGQAVLFAGWGQPEVGELTVGKGKVSVVEGVRIGVDFDGTPSQSNTCFGDSGGPLYRMLPSGAALIGITSNGSAASCGAAERSVYANAQAPSVLNFIRSKAPGVSVL